MTMVAQGHKGLTVCQAAGSLCRGRSGSTDKLGVADKATKPVKGGVGI